MATSSHRSPFLTLPPVATADTLSILHLKRDLCLPTILRTQDTLNEGYAEGKVTNTRFGSFPHSTLIGVPWGTQVRASKVDTGSRGWKAWVGKGHKKRKRVEEGGEEGDEVLEDGLEERIKTGDEVELKSATAASTGFLHLLPPTPELWTAGLPHRTQVVYTPDYSYILHRLRVRPGSVIIEAGAGSGSFTHAAARAVFKGYPAETSIRDARARDMAGKAQNGKVYSFEFHEQRYESLKAEIKEHGLDGIVEIAHRDVCQDGFMTDVNGGSSPNANAIFLDLPAPWLALKHLTRKLRHKAPISDPPISSGSPGTHDPAVCPSISQIPGLVSSQHTSSDPIDNLNPPSTPRSSPESALDPTNTVYICTFSPCIEQVQRTVSTLRNLGWHSISMVELSSRRIEVYRQRVGLQEEGLRGVNASPANVEEALNRLREVEGRTAHFHELERRRKAEEVGHIDVEKSEGGGAREGEYVSKAERLERIKQREKERKLYKEGQLIHRSEAELKTHTSYLVFAFLPQEWSEEDEQKAQKLWSNSADLLNSKGKGSLQEDLPKPTSKRQQKKVSKASAVTGLQE